MIWRLIYSLWVSWPTVTNTNISSPLSLHTACWQCRELNHRLNSSMSHMACYEQKDLFFFFFSLPSLNPSGFLHILSLSCHHIRLWSFRLCSTLSDLHGRLPVYVRRASSQSAVKAVILLVAIYYPVVCLKKDWKQAKLGAGCWVSRHAKLQSESTTDLYTSPPFSSWKCVNLPEYFYFLKCAAAHLVKCSFICLSCFSQRSRICTLTFFCCRWGMECAGLQVLKITKQHEAAECKLWMRSRSANTARCDMRGDFVLDSPLAVSYLCSVCVLPCLLCAHFTLQLQVIKTASLS